MEVLRNKVSFRLRDLLSLLNKRLERGVVFNQNLVKIVAVKTHIEHICSESKCASYMQRTEKHFILQHATS